MAVETQHPEYIARCAQWKRCRDAVAGEDAVHLAGELYLPKLKDQETTEYDAYKKRAGFYNATGRTVSGLIGMLFRKPPTEVVPSGIEDDLSDVDMKGKPFLMFAQDIAEECLIVGRVGVLVDHAAPPPSTIVATVANAKELGLRPMLLMYKAEEMINWKTDRINNRTVLSMVVVTEEHEYPIGQGPDMGPFAPKSTEFSPICETRYRVLDIDATNSNTYRQRVFRKDKNNNDVLCETVIPLMNGKPLSVIPFTFIGPDGIDMSVEAPPLLDLVNVNMGHYRTNADYEHGCHFTGLPTPWIAGYQNPTPEKPPSAFYIGSTKAWVFADANAKAEYLEFTGQGLGELTKNLDRKEGQMAVLGARMLAPEKKQAETSTTAAIHRTGENSVLSGIGISVSLALKKVLNIFAEWAGAITAGSNTAIEFEINRDFMPVSIDAPTLVAIVKAWQSGAISFETMFDLLQRGDMIESEKTSDDEQKEIDAAPAPQPAPAVAPGSDPNAPPAGPVQKPSAAKVPPKA